MPDGAPTNCFDRRIYRVIGNEAVVEMHTICLVWRIDLARSEFVIGTEPLALKKRCLYWFLSFHVQGLKIAIDAAEDAAGNICWDTSLLETGFENI